MRKAKEDEGGGKIGKEKEEFCKMNKVVIVTGWSWLFK